MSQPPSIDRLLNSVPDAPETVLQQLRNHPQLASKQDAHGYSLLHAAVSYGHSELVKVLIEQFHVDPNLKDEDGETPLFNAESVEMAKELVELGVDINARNDDGQTAAEKLDDEDEQPLVAAFLREATSHPAGAVASTIAQTAGAADSEAAIAGTLRAHTNGIHNPPPLPNGLDVSVGTMQAGDEGEAPDPEFRRRIEELATRADFHEETGQQELRELVSQVVSGINNVDHNPATRRRLE